MSIKSLSSAPLSRYVTWTLVVAALIVWALIVRREAHVFRTSNDVDLEAAVTLGEAGVGIQAVYFYQPDCPYCKQFKPKISRLVAEHPSLLHVRFVLVPDSATMAKTPPPDAWVKDGAGLPAQLGVKDVPALWLGRARVVGSMPYAYVDSLLHDQTGTIHEGSALTWSATPN